MMWVVGIGWASAIANAAEDGTFNKLADKMKKGGDKLGSALDKITWEVSSAVAPAVAVVAPAVTVANGVNLSNLSEQQKKGMDFVMWTSSRLPKMIEDHANKSTNTNEKWKVADYINFIHSQGFQAIPLWALIYNTNSNITIFRDDNNYLDPSIASLPEAQNLNKQLLKKVLRMYILGKYAISLPVGWKKEWDKELEEFKTKYPETTNKDKKFSDFIKEIHK